MFLLQESLKDTIIVYMIIRALTKPYIEWDAYKLGIIDDKGEKIKDPKTSEERECWNVLTRLLWKLKLIMHRFVGANHWMHYLTIAYLMRESTLHFADEEKFRNKYLDGFNYDIQLKLYSILEELDKSDLLIENKYDIEFRYLQYQPKIINILENSTNFKELLEMVGSGDAAGVDSIFQNKPCFEMNDETEFHSFCHGKKQFHRWKKHDKSEKIKDWAKLNPTQDFYVKHQENHYLVKR